MATETITVIPLGFIFLLAIALAMISAAFGWFFARRRFQRRHRQENRRIWQQMQTFVNTLPFATIITSANGKIKFQNNKPITVLEAFNGGKTIPLTIDAAIERVSRNQKAETLELPLPDNTQRQQILIAPFWLQDTQEPMVIVLFLPTWRERSSIHLEMVSQMGHELRTPLTAVMGHVEIIASCDITEKELWQRSLSIVSTELERLERLVKEFINLSRLEMQTPKIQPVNIRLLAEEAISILYDQAQMNQVDLLLQTPHSLPRIAGDKDRLKQVFINLVENGIKYAPGKTVTVQISAQTDDVLVEIRDTGPGIPAADLPYLFNPFFRLESNKSLPGSGLGLAIVKTILDQHQSPISVRSHVGKGTTFSFSLSIAA